MVFGYLLVLFHILGPATKRDNVFPLRQLRLLQITTMCYYNLRSVRDTHSNKA